MVVDGLPEMAAWILDVERECVNLKLVAMQHHPAIKIQFMCGIIGYVGKKAASPILLEGLRRLEYRGYDSAGVAVLHDADLRGAQEKGPD